MASCIVAPSHYLKQCGLIIKLIIKVMWHLSQWIIMKDLNIPISKMRLKLICWDNFTPLLEIIYSAVIIVFFVIVVSWYLLSPSLIPSQGAHHQGEIREVMENVKKISLIWKNHGIPFPGKNHGKVMEFLIPEKKICFDLHFNACITI